MSVAQYGFNEKEDLSFLGPKRTRTVLHKFSLTSALNNFTDRYDHYQIYQIVSDWAQSEKGKWCCENATELTLHKHMDSVYLTLNHIITGMLTEKQLTFFNIKFS